MEPLDALWGALVLTAIAGLAAARARWKRGQRVFPRVRTRMYLSIRSPDDETQGGELGPNDVEIIPARPPDPPPPRSLLDEFDDRPTPDTRPPKPRRRPPP